MNLQLLAAELALPAYAGLSDQEAADAINAKTVAVDVVSVSGSDIFEATVQADYSALSATQKNLYHAIIAMASVPVKGTNTRAALLAMFGPGSQTRTNLGALQTTTVSWALLNLGQLVGDGHVRSVREGV